MTSENTLSEDAQREVRRIVGTSRVAGVVVALTLLTVIILINMGDLWSLDFAVGIVIIVAGLGSYVALSTVARQGHARILERSMDEVAQLSAELKRLADRDPLTGLHNQRSFNEALEEALEEARAAGSRVSLLVADLDNFKLLNDAFGHQFGDTVLCSVAEVFSGLGGGACVAARLGGDEFAVILAGEARTEAVAEVARAQEALAAIKIHDRDTPALGSFGIGTYPDDGETVRALFTAADGRMYSEKNRRKAEALAGIAGASRKLFVRAGRAMRPEHSVDQIMCEIATATLEELSLSSCVIAMPAYEHHAAVLAVAGDLDPGIEARDLPTASGRVAAALSSAMPRDAWVIDVPIPAENGPAGEIVLGGLPTNSFRPDASMVIALADLIHAVVASGRARDDAQRAGRERDIHNDLAYVLARGGSLAERMAAVTRLIAEFTGATAVSIEGLAQSVGGGVGLAESLMFGATEAFFQDWQALRETAGAKLSVDRLAAAAPLMITDIGSEDRLDAEQRRLLVEAGIKSVGITAIRIDDELQGLLCAASFRSNFFGNELMSVLTAIADHLAPAIKVAVLREELEASYLQLELASRESLARLSAAAEARDPHTAGHLRRIGTYSYALAREIGLPEEEARGIERASVVHDLGKLNLPDEVLSRPGSLTTDDWTRMQAHPAHGERLIGDSPRFAVERSIARWHHERWDGSGYPDGLQGEAIPLPARIVAVADTFDALTTQRPYKPAWPVDVACAEIIRQRERFYCPGVVDALEQLWRRGQLGRLAAEGIDESADGQMAAAA